jgi:hypothetical protein
VFMHGTKRNQVIMEVVLHGKLCKLCNMDVILHGKLCKPVLVTLRL